MAVPELTIEELKSILRDAAGEVDGTALRGDILDTTFSDLGYDSVAMLEAGSRIEIRHGVKLPDSVLAETGTPRALIAAVNQQRFPEE